MFHIAVQIKELVSSNVTSLVENASNPEKMLRLLRRELEEGIISLQGDLTRSQRRVERLEAEIDQLDLRQADWTEKARFAVEKKREDLARSALLARETTRSDLAAKQAEREQTAADVSEIAAAMATLEDKLAETRTQLEEAVRVSASAAGKPLDSVSATERRMERIAALEKRAQFAAEGRTQVSDAAIEAEIAELDRNARIDAELAELKGAAKAAPAREAKGK